MSAKDPILDPLTLDFERPLARLEDIRKLIPQRDAIEQLTAVVYENLETNTVAGYRDVTDGEFWVSGHMPGLPLMPGVIMCEAAAQLASFFVQRNDLLGCEMVGFGGLDEVRFRGTVVPGDRLVIINQMIQVRRGRMIRARFQCFVGSGIVCEGQLIGVPIPVEALRASGLGGSTRLGGSTT
ncbi:3-hydroxyacyl-[acyl-carrier-protein] dehydratase FabZ [Botrimarina colliarenosi]|uniref:3-hydroxyacyl-[acyl-carrier-protein] dehydratase FabZ n=1 Tax=Botrimarina colliarenosi TaxID=2528001 RepID=A0A5C6A5S8_9BACT|nr:beta-hydroxyacyl-ACP dehydratase [Botrimarina colliarenosi]TWT94750.1 3-hydroxyacyl-[acyl-carrier-protein] dehydratase FabZ [Botrimarina colliarenosi]